MDDKRTAVKVQWHCGYYVGEYKWHGTERYEPDDCDTDFETEIEPDELLRCIDEGEHLQGECPNCKANNNTADDEPTIVLPNGDSFEWWQRFYYIPHIRSAVRNSLHGLQN